MGNIFGSGKLISWNDIFGSNKYGGKKYTISDASKTPKVKNVTDRMDKHKKRTYRKIHKYN